jgi:hypothetical protein
VATVKLTLSAHHQGKRPGDSLEVDAPTAKRLISAGVAVPATKTAAKAAGVPADTAASVKD